MDLMVTVTVLGTVEAAKAEVAQTPEKVYDWLWVICC